MASLFNASCASRLQSLSSPAKDAEATPSAFPKAFFLTAVLLSIWTVPEVTFCFVHPHIVSCWESFASGTLNFAKKFLPLQPILPKCLESLPRDLRNQSAPLVQTPQALCGDKFLGYDVPAFLCRACCRLLLLPLCSCCSIRQLPPRLC